MSPSNLIWHAVLHFRDHRCIVFAWKPSHKKSHVHAFTSEMKFWDNNPFNVTTFLNKNKSSTPENANDLYFAPYNSCLKGQSTPLPKRQCGAYQPGPRWPLDHHLSTQRRRFLHLGLLCENSVAKKSNTRHWKRKCKPHDIGCMIKCCTVVLPEVLLSLV